MILRLSGIILLVANFPLLARAADNELSEKERADGWLLLFDGKTTDGWMSIKRESIPAKNVQEGALNPHPCNYMLVHARAWDDFVLSLDFKISPKCNSGIFIRTWPLTPRPGKDVGFNGMEIAVDDTQTAGFHDTGALYDLVKPEANAMKPAGEWNHAVITCNDNRIEIEINGRRVTQTDLDQWTEPNKRPDGTGHKFDVAYRDHPRKGYIGLQDHGSDCWYKNIKLLPIKPPKSGLPTSRLWDIDALRKTPKVTWEDTTGPLRKLYYEGEPRDGQPTRVFAYCAFPESSNGKSPGVVLIHGGGGTAFSEWAALWAKRGYVAIAMDLAGKGPDKQPLSGGGPDQSDDVKFPKTEIPLKDVWTYHAVSAAIRGASVLASLPEVDADRLVVTGISWGGYLTCIVAGLDDRFKAAVPVYGCGYLHEDSVWLNRFAEMESGWRQTWIDYFDPSQHVGRAKMPVLFVNGTNDFAYPMGSYQKTYRCVKNRALCVTVNMPHGHPQGWAPAEIGAFIDFQLKRPSAPVLPALELVSQISPDQKRVSAVFKNTELKRAQLHYTTDLGPWQKRNWQSVDAQIDNSTLSAEIPPTRPLTGFFTLTNKNDLTASTEHFTLVTAPAVAAAPQPPEFPFDAVAARRYQRAYAEFSRLPLELVNDLGMKFLLIPPGTFLMGSPDDEPGHNAGGYDEARHQVTLTRPFYLAAHETTVGQFRRFVESEKYVTDAEKNGGGHAHDDKAVWIHRPGTHWKKPGYAAPDIAPFVLRDEFPVVHVSHTDARAFARWVQNRSPKDLPAGWTCDLPSEPQWEWACRAGTATRYWWGQDADESGKVANVGDRSLKRTHPDWPRDIMPMDDGHAFVAPVGTYRANPFGLHDMLGNVWEFCSTHYADYPRAPVTDPPDGDPKRGFAVRGGGWSNLPTDARSASRNADPPHFAHSNLGFRLAFLPPKP